MQHKLSVLLFRQNPYIIPYIIIYLYIEQHKPGLFNWQPQALACVQKTQTKAYDCYESVNRLLSTTYQHLIIVTACAKSARGISAT
jgi:hypothetical protein